MYPSKSFHWSALLLLLIDLPMQWTILVLEHKEYRPLYGQINFSFLVHYSEPVEWLFLTRHRETLFVQMHTFREGLLYNTCPDMYWLPYRWMVSRCVLNIAEFLCTRASLPNSQFSSIHIGHLFISKFIFSQKNDYNFFFAKARYFR